MRHYRNILVATLAGLVLGGCGMVGGEDGIIRDRQLDYKQATSAPPLVADWHVCPGEVRHTFTHFHLRLEVRVAEVPVGTIASKGAFLGADAFAPGDLPTLMRKVHDHALAGFQAV